MKKQKTLKQKPQNQIIKDDVIKIPRFKPENGFKTTEKNSSVMKKITSRNTKPEISLRKELWKNGIRYRINYPNVIGKPDLIIPSMQIAIFVDGDFWHGLNWHQRKNKLKSNKAYWIPKIERNMQRDKEVNQILSEKGWTVIRFWESEVQKKLPNCIAEIKKTIKQRI